MSPGLSIFALPLAQTLVIIFSIPPEHKALKNKVLTSTSAACCEVKLALGGGT